jgi:hypothetical protein
VLLYERLASDIALIFPVIPAGQQKAPDFTLQKKRRQ